MNANVQRAEALAYVGSALSRVAEERDEQTLDRALMNPDARLYLLRGRTFLVKAGEPAPDPQFTLDEARALGADLSQAVLLGWTQGDLSPRLALALGAGTEPSAGLEELDLRAAGVKGSLPTEIEGDLAQALHLLNWHSRTLFCGACGAPARPALAGYRRDCTRCGAHHFPRTDPVVIMLVHDGAGRCVLSRAHHYEPKRWSTLAGFVEAGETIEDAVRREVREEVGLTVGRVDYVMSQPWPFPGSLMIGCIAEATAGDLTIQVSELEDGRWFGREELRTMIERTHPDGLETPPPFAIAYHLARRFAFG